MLHQLHDKNHDKSSEFVSCMCKTNDKQAALTDMWKSWKFEKWHKNYLTTTYYKVAYHSYTIQWDKIDWWQSHTLIIDDLGLFLLHSSRTAVFTHTQTSWHFGTKFSFFYNNCNKWDRCKHTACFNGHDVIDVFYLNNSFFSLYFCYLGQTAILALVTSHTECTLTPFTRCT